jgi:hypothetical protein
MSMYQQKHGMNDFVPGNFPEPYNPIWQTPMQPNWDQTPQIAMGDFVDANFPEPNNPIWRPGGIGGIGCGGGCGCADCGMGALAVPAWAMTLPAPLNGVDPAIGVPYVYWGLGAAALIFVVPMLTGGKRGRR